jgi:hypothetical protein
VVQKTEGWDVLAHVSFVNNPSEFCKWWPVWSGLNNVFHSFIGPGVGHFVQNLWRVMKSIPEFNKCQPVPSKVVMNYVLVPPSFANVCWSSVRKSSRSWFLITDFNLLLTLTLPSRTSLKEFLLTLTYSFIIRFGLSSSSPPSFSWYSRTLDCEHNPF